MSNEDASTISIEALPPLRDVIRDFGLRAEKSLGQNFLLDLNLTAKIVRAAGDIAGRDAVEIGPGPGGLTRAILLQGVRHLTAVEYDRRAIDALGSLQRAAAGRLSLLHADALHFDIQALVKETGKPITILANLPYNIATPLLTGWLKIMYETPNMVEGMVLMFQKEVAQRIAARLEDKAYGRLSILSQFVCETRLVFDVPPSAFTPPPAVVSSIVKFTPRPKHENGPRDIASLEKITAAAFGQRRKMIRGSLKAYAEEISSCGIDPQKRAEDLSIPEYVALARAYEQREF